MNMNSWTHIFFASYVFIQILLILDWKSSESLVGIENGMYHRIDQVAMMNKMKNKTSIALIVIYVGNSLPIWIQGFLLGAIKSKNQTKFTWYIFSVCEDENICLNNGYGRYFVAENINIIQISRKELYSRLSILYNFSIPLNHFEEAFGSWPYALVEFKPCLANLFEDYIMNFSHWGYADIDLVPGNLDAFITSEILERFDIYTSSFGDQQRLYLRGQLTILRNNQIITRLWHRCTRLYHLKARMTSYIHSSRRRWPFESAEGCFSKAAIMSNLSIYFDVSQFSDAFKATVPEKEVYVYPYNVLKCNSQYLEDYAPKSRNITLIPNYQVKFNQSCAYWINPSYQVCLQDKSLQLRSYSLGLVNKRVTMYDKPNLRSRRPCSERAFIHFQAWKSNYYSFTVNRISEKLNYFLISESGYVPVLNKKSSRFTIKTKHLGISLPEFHCAHFSDNLKECLCTIRDQHISKTNLDKQAMWQKSAVTLIMVVDPKDVNQVSNAASFAKYWRLGPVLIISDLSDSHEPFWDEILIYASIISISSGHCSTYEQFDIVSRLAYVMLNVALANTHTDIVFIASVEKNAEISSFRFDTILRGFEINPYNAFMPTPPYSTVIPSVIFNLSLVNENYGPRYFRFPEELISPVCSQYDGISVRDIFELFDFVVISASSFLNPFSLNQSNSTLGIFPIACFRQIERKSMDLFRGAIKRYFSRAKSLKISSQPN